MTKYIYIPYKDKEEAKALGAKWDRDQKSWFIPDEINESVFSKWIAKIDPVAAFASDLIAAGCFLEPGEPICDGNGHRIKVTGDKNQKSGFYVMHLDEVPNGYFINNRTKDEFKKCYINKGIHEEESDAEKEKRIAEFRHKQELLKREKEELAEEKARFLATKIKKLQTTLSEESPYFKKKGIVGTKYTYIEKVNRDGADLVLTCIPIYDVTGKLMTVQYIKADGEKRFVKGAFKKGGMHIIEGRIKDFDEIIIVCEGYATASTIQNIINKLHFKAKVVAAIDSGNILPVAESLKSNYQDKKIVIAADNDRFSEIKNTGLEEAELAAKTIGSSVMLPNFLGEKGTDFNDLAVFEGEMVATAQIEKFLKQI